MDVCRHLSGRQPGVRVAISGIAAWHANMLHMNCMRTNAATRSVKESVEIALTIFLDFFKTATVAWWLAIVLNRASVSTGPFTASFARLPSVDAWMLRSFDAVCE